MNGFDIIKNALSILGEKEPNRLFIGADVRTEYLLFFEGNPPTEKQEAELEIIGVTFVAKYECYGIERFFLWDLAHEQ
ncbi:hypothetical protein MUK70_11900 [Dyadobacter chenwenxiniae]|uniref:Uncharacterized protein n=1 Tax=Dyadobacter chenwenxiniae TaxID=2906456 RepID=A0A9X1PGS6_9BACT|nr:hypothetical protein [Dyadobacter chenwenxiniae]MCF0059945.1 hypothetical protein [Dyadobacter chenwenxiniae]UON85684.1 hypothetical protein MUK70_11900 [Dyadobacter chenwenxiniae]